LLSMMANLMRPDQVGPAEVGFRTLTALSKIIPDQVLSALFENQTPELRSVSSAA